MAEPSMIVRRPRRSARTVTPRASRAATRTTASMVVISVSVEPNSSLANVLVWVSSVPR